MKTLLGYINHDVFNVIYVIKYTIYCQTILLNIMNVAIILRVNNTWQSHEDKAFMAIKKAHITS